MHPTKQAAACCVELCDVCDDTILAIWRRIYSFLNNKDILSGMMVCKSFSKELPSLVTSVHIKSGRCMQQRLENLASTFPNIKDLKMESVQCIHGSREDDPPAGLDFSKVKMEALEHLSMFCVTITSCCFTRNNTPMLRTLKVRYCDWFETFDLDLPHLEDMEFDHIGVREGSSFAPSLNGCPSLKMYRSNKVWGLDIQEPELHMPECKVFVICKSELEGVELWAPKLTYLALRCCHELTHVRIKGVDEGPRLPPIHVELSGELDIESQRHLRQHGGFKIMY